MDDGYKRIGSTMSHLACSGFDSCGRFIGGRVAHFQRQLMDANSIICGPGALTSSPPRYAALGHPASAGNLDLSQALAAKKCDVIDGSAHAPIMHICVIWQSICALFNGA